MLKPGGRLVTTNIFSNHYEPYVMLPPLWHLDYFVMNRFADCKVYILVIPTNAMLSSQIDVFTIDADALLNPTRVVSAFAAPHMMSTIVIAEKGWDSTFETMPTQQQ